MKSSLTGSAAAKAVLLLTELTTALQQEAFWLERGEWELVRASHAHKDALLAGLRQCQLCAPSGFSAEISARLAELAVLQNTNAHFLENKLAGVRAELTQLGVAAGKLRSGVASGRVGAEPTQWA